MRKSSLPYSVLMLALLTQVGCGGSHRGGPDNSPTGSLGAASTKLATGACIVCMGSNASFYCQMPMALTPTGSLPCGTVGLETTNCAISQCGQITENNNVIYDCVANQVAAPSTTLDQRTFCNNACDSYYTQPQNGSSVGQCGASF